MRILLAATAIALLTVGAHAQGMMGQEGGKGKKHQAEAPKAEDQAKKKAAEDAYQKALQNIPTSNEKIDPWRSVR